MQPGPDYDYQCTLFISVLLHAMEQIVTEMEIFFSCSEASACLFFLLFVFSLRCHVGINTMGLYRIGGVNSKVQKLMATFFCKSMKCNVSLLADRRHHVAWYKQRTRVILGSRSSFISDKTESLSSLTSPWSSDTALLLETGGNRRSLELRFLSYHFISYKW